MSPSAKPECQVRLRLSSSGRFDENGGINIEGLVGVVRVGGAHVRRRQTSRPVIRPPKTFNTGRKLWYYVITY